MVLKHKFRILESHLPAEKSEQTGLENVHIPWVAHKWVWQQATSWRLWCRWVTYVRSTHTVLHGRTETGVIKKTVTLRAVGNALHSMTYSGFLSETVLLDCGLSQSWKEVCVLSLDQDLSVLDPPCILEDLYQKICQNMSMLILPSCFCSGKFSLGERLSSFQSEAHVLKGKSKTKRSFKLWVLFLF